MAQMPIPAPPMIPAEALTSAAEKRKVALAKARAAQAAKRARRLQDASAASRQPQPSPEPQQPLQEPPDAEEVPQGALSEPLPDFREVEWAEIPLEEGNRLLAVLQRDYEHALKVMQQRQIALDIVECHGGCKRTFPPAHACMSMTLREPSTLLPYNVYFCSQECVRQFNRAKQGLPKSVWPLPR